MSPKTKTLWKWSIKAVTNQFRIYDSIILPTFRHSTKCNNTESMICGHFHLIRKHWSVYDRMLDVAIKWKFTTISWRLSLWIHNFVGLATLASRCEWCWTFGVEMAINHNSRFPCIGLVQYRVLACRNQQQAITSSYISSTKAIGLPSAGCVSDESLFIWETSPFLLRHTWGCALIAFDGCYLESIENKSIDFNYVSTKWFRVIHSQNRRNQFLSAGPGSISSN